MIDIADSRYIVALAEFGGGNLVCSLSPNLKLYGGSCLVLDPKGELERDTAKDRAAMRLSIHVLHPYNVSG